MSGVGAGGASCGHSRMTSRGCKSVRLGHGSRARCANLRDSLAAAHCNSAAACRLKLARFRRRMAREQGIAVSRGSRPHVEHLFNLSAPCGGLPSSGSLVLLVLWCSLFLRALSPGLWLRGPMQLDIVARAYVGVYMSM